ncbi:MAG: TolC family protein [Bacteroidales bacterium]|jgi:outer membrane protein TolC|nr:TolC family protein [Bacteroidales bacterium]
MNIRKIFFIVICAAFTVSARAQVVELSLSQSIEMAIDSSLQSFISENMYLSSYWQYRTFKAGRLPSLTLNATPLQYYRDFTKRYDSQQNIDIYRQQQSLYSYGNLSLKQNLDVTGGTFYIDSELGYVQNFGDNDYTQFTSVPVRIGYSQSLFGFNSFKWEKRIEPLKYEKAKKQLLYSHEQISETVINYFFNLAMAQAQYDMAVDNAASADTLYNIGQQRFKIAGISQSDLMTLKLDAINARNTLKNAEISLKRNMFAFVSYLNMDKDTLIQLTLPNKPQEFVIDAAHALELAKENNPDYLQYRQDVLESEREVERTKRSSLFDASFSASVGFNQVANTFNQAYQNPIQQDVVSIGLSVPIVDWGVRKGKANMARNNLNMTKLSAQQKEISLEQNIMLTVNDFNIQQDLIASAEEAIELATMAYNATRQRFITGQSDISSLTLSLDRYKNAQTNYISALKNYWLSYYNLRRLTLYDFERQKSLSLMFDKMFHAE